MPALRPIFRGSPIVLSSDKEKKHGRGMAGDGGSIGHREARVMLDAFASVGATQFDVTWTTCGGAKDGFRRGVRLADLTRALPSMLDDATRKQRNLIVRPHG